MSIREALIDYSRGDNLRLYWRLSRWRERTRRKLIQDVLTFFLNRTAHHHGGYIGNGAVSKVIRFCPTDFMVSLSPGMPVSDRTAGFTRMSP